MNIYYVLAMLFTFGIGMLFGIYVTNKFHLKSHIGILHVDTSDPDSKPYFFLEIDNGKSHLIKDKANVILKVKIR